jgi:tetratricopeptide (TPR) repeat protein
METTVPEAEAGPVLAAARALILAGRWEAADQLLASTRTADPAERAEVALAQAQVAVELRQWRGAGDPAAALEAATALSAAGGSPQTAFDLDLLRLFSDYWAELMPGGGVPPHFGPAGRDPRVLDELRDRAGRLTAAAPGGRRTARAAFYAGLIADNLRGEPDRAGVLFAQALAACQPGEDDDYAAEALRHLGGCAQEAGDLPLARQRWERSAELAQRAGWLPLVLAQFALLAELARDTGGQAEAGVLARETHRWPTALGLHRLAAQVAPLSVAAP